MPSTFLNALTVLTGRPPIFIAAHAGPQGGVVDDPSALQVPQKILDLIDRDRIADADVDPAPFLERPPAIDADQASLGVEHRSTRIARIDRGIGLQAIG